ncbi:hypothetical protein EJV47_25630 [Hymenobacter gummosus]|uniref:Uncharacterized protein n=1 Tax=Hymenobacter gummosus TaxID=1776032 RepID=A0A431TV82_9BACT|nr:hypothetical protein [Hymenobacter gummosus]RTQ45262.1 hypothetical protein EJV47_25630 [Hymenobacter gummosus]
MNTPPAWLTTVSHLVFLVSSFGVVVPLAIGLRHWRLLFPAGRSIVYYFGFWTVEALVDQWSRKVLHTNVYLYHVSVLVETWLLGWAYYHTFDLKPVRRIMPWVALVFTLVALVDFFILAGPHQLNRVTRAVQVVLMLIMVMLYFEQWTREVHTGSPWRNLMFISSVGLAVYYTGSVMGYLLQNGAPTLTQRIISLLIDSTYNVALVLMTLGLWRETAPPVAPDEGPGA